MRTELALLVAMGLVGSSTMPEWGIAQETQPATTPAVTAPATTAPKATDTVKPTAACGFCLEDGTKVPLTLGRELSSGKEVTGNRVDFIVSEDILVQGVVVIPKGSKAMGTIVQAQGKRRMGRAGKLNVTIDEVRLADGERVKLRSIQETTGKGRQGLMTGAMIATGVLFWPAAPVFLMMKGKDVVIAQGTPVASYVDGDSRLEAANFGSTVKPNEVAPIAAATPAASVTPSPNPTPTPVPAPQKE